MLIHRKEEGTRIRSRKRRLGMPLVIGLLCVLAGWVAGTAGSPIQPPTSNGKQLGIPPVSNQQEILEFLETARVISKKRIRTGSAQPFKVLLEKDGIQAYGVFRDVNTRTARAVIKGTIRLNFRDAAVFEIAAYELSQILGLYLVPPTVLRKMDGKRGSLQIWIEDSITGKERVEKELFPPNSVEWGQLSQIRQIFDTLVHNDDRNLGNFLIDQDWNLWLIDHTRCFYPFNRLINRGLLTNMDASLWEKLKTSSHEEVRKRLKSPSKNGRSTLCSHAGTCC